MPRFEYSALSPSGEVISGELDGPDAAAIIERLHEDALLPIGAVEKQPGRALSTRFYRRVAGRLSGRDLALFSRQLSRLLNASLPLDRALEILTTLIGNRHCGQVIRRTLERVRDGASLAEAIAAQGKAYPPAYISMVRAGEIGGALRSVLARLADFHTRSEAIRQRVISALIYPAILVLVAALSVILVLTVVLPQFKPLFQESGVELPLSTRIVMSIGDAAQDHGWIILLALAFGWGVWLRVRKRPAVALRRDKLILLLPIVRDLVSKFEICRFSRTLAVLLVNGVPAARALAMCTGTINNRVIAGAVETASARFNEGESLSTALAGSGCFPSLSTQLIRIGEETGRLEEMLQEIAEIYDQEVQRLMDRLLTLLVPTITIGMGMIIAFVIVAVMTAMISINNLAM